MNVQCSRVHDTLKQFLITNNESLSNRTSLICQQINGNENGETRITQNWVLFWKRVHTFTSNIWQGNVSPLECAQYGWVQEDVYMLQCVTCKKYLSCHLPHIYHYDTYVQCCEKFKTSILTQHDSLCLWRSTQCPDYFLKVPIQTHQDALAVYQSYTKSLIDIIHQLPKVSLKNNRCIKTMEPHIQDLTDLAVRDCLPLEYDKECLRVLIALALCGWSKKSDSTLDVLHCELCKRQLGLWNYQKISSEPDEELNGEDSDCDSFVTTENSENEDIEEKGGTIVEKPLDSNDKIVQDINSTENQSKTIPLKKVIPPTRLIEEQVDSEIASIIESVDQEISTIPKKSDLPSGPAGDSDNQLEMVNQEAEVTNDVSNGESIGTNMVSEVSDKSDPEVDDNMCNENKENVNEQPNNLIPESFVEDTDCRPEELIPAKSDCQPEDSVAAQSEELLPAQSDCQFEELMPAQVEDLHPNQQDPSVGELDEMTSRNEGNEILIKPSEDLQQRSESSDNSDMESDNVSSKSSCVEILSDSDEEQIAVPPQRDLSYNSEDSRSGSYSPHSPEEDDEEESEDSNNFRQMDRYNAEESDGEHSDYKYQRRDVYDNRESRGRYESRNEEESGSGSDEDPEEEEDSDCVEIIDDDDEVAQLDGTYDDSDDETDEKKDNCKDATSPLDLSSRSLDEEKDDDGKDVKDPDSESQIVNKGDNNQCSTESVSGVENSCDNRGDHEGSADDDGTVATINEAAVEEQVSEEPLSGTGVAEIKEALSEGKVEELRETQEISENRNEEEPTEASEECGENLHRMEKSDEKSKETEEISEGIEESKASDKDSDIRAVTPTSMETEQEEEIQEICIDAQAAIKEHLVESMQIDESVVQTAMDLCNKLKRPLEDGNAESQEAAKKSKPSLRKLSLLEEHHTWCPWVHFKESAGQEQTLPGWHYLLKLLISKNSTPKVRRSHSRQSLTPEGLRDIRRLLNSWTS